MTTPARCFALLLLALTAGAAQAQSLRCKNDFTQSGDSKASVLLKCGQPLVKDSFCKPAEPVRQEPGSSPVVVVTPCETVDEWTYNPGYGQFLTTLRFESGRLVSLRYGERITSQQ